MTDINIMIEKQDKNIGLSIVKQSGTDNYNELYNKPSINGIELIGNLTNEDLGLNTTPENVVTKKELEIALATKQDIGIYLTEETDPVYMADKPNIALKSEIPDLSDLVTKEELEKLNEIIPATANLENQLADRGFVNSSIQTSTAHFRGNWEKWSDIPTDSALYPIDSYGNHSPTPNDYLVVVADETQNGGTWRYKYTGDWLQQGKNGWKAEYQVNETPLTAEQLAALNSGITAETVDGLVDYVKNTDYADGNKGGVIKMSTYYGTEMQADGKMHGIALSLAQYLSADRWFFISKGTLENVLTQYPKVVEITEAEYNALATKDPNTLYLIED